MEIWELVRLLLVAATGAGQTFNPALVGGSYFRNLMASAGGVQQTYSEMLEIAQAVADEMEAAELIQPAPSRQGSNVIVGAMARTQFGGELLQALNGRNVVAFFEGRQADIEPGEIRRILHQLNS